MASRVGLDRQAVVAAAIDVVDRDGPGSLTMARLAADLGIRAPSLYAHVRGQAGLRRALWLWVLDDLRERMAESVMGRSGEDALLAFATALRDYSRTYPGRYQLSLDPPRPLDDEAREARRRANAPFQAVIRSFGLSGAEAVHTGRALRAAIHGFLGLEAYDVWGPDGRDESFAHLVGMLIRGLPQQQPAACTGT